MYHCVLAGSAWLTQLHPGLTVWVAGEAASEITGFFTYKLHFHLTLSTSEGC